MQIDKKTIAERFAKLPADKQKVFLEALRRQGVDFARLPIVPSGAQDRAVLSYAQLRQWFLWQLDPSSTAYHISGALTLRGALDAAALEASFGALVERHASLRTVFRPDAQGLGAQHILAQAQPAFERVDLSALAGAGAEAAAQARRQAGEAARRLAEAPFDLADGPLLRIGLIRLGAEEHVLVVVMHHIVSDRWSMQILVDEFMAQYGARVRGETPQLAPLPVRYADYAAWQRNWLEAGEKDRQLAYWTGELGTANPLLQLPTDRPRRADARYRAVRHTVELPRALVQALHARAHAAGATLFTVLLAGFQVLLHRLTGEADIRVGVPIANRGRAEIEGVIGFFVNTQVLRNVIGGRTPLAAVLARARDAALGAQAHQDLPFEQLVEALRPERTSNASPLFQVMFNHDRVDDRAFARMPGVEVEDFPLGDPAAQFELVLNTSEHEDGRVEATLLYAAELFDASSVERMAGHYLAVLQALADAPQQAVADVALIGEAERRLLDQWAVNARVHEGAEPVHRLIERHAAQTPDATALLFGDEALGYGELNARANRLAHRLAALGVGVESRVGLAVERSVEMMVGILAVLKAGGAYVPLDPEQPADRLAYMAQDSGIGLLLTQSHLQVLAPWDPALRILALDTLDLAGESAADPQVPLHGANLAYVIYTSGSTGRPKGAAIRHDALFSCMAWMQQTYVLGAADTVLHKAPFGFDVSVWEMFWPLTTGARLLIARPGDHRDPERLVELIRRHQVTTLNFVPSMLQAFLAYEGIEATTRLRYIICGGEAMPAATQREALERLQGASLQNLYGPTEATIHVTQWTCRDDGRSQVPIGRPISDTQALVLDASLNPVPVGVAGELYLGGVNLARGYLNRAGLTAERFVATHDGRRLYRTGDLVRWNNEGQLEYLGRIDHQVKVRGFRIELGEIEAQLLAQPEVRQAVVVARQGADGASSASLVAYVALDDEDAAGAELLRETLRAALPDYMVPRAIVALPALPLNANGKVDRKALPEPGALLRSRAYEAPQDPAARALAALWAEVLQIDAGDVGLRDNFFELGGDSILCLKLLARIRQALPGGERLGLPDLMQAGDLQDLASRLGRRAGPVHDAVCLHAEGTGTPLFCLPGLIVNTREFRTLADALRGDRPVHGFVSHVYTRRRWRGFAVRALAAEYAEHILATATGGRCALLGWSLGGDLAFEVAQQLQGRIEVVFCGMVDVFEIAPLRASRALSAAERARADEALEGWLARSEMAAQWRALIGRMDAGERAWVAQQMLDPAQSFPLDGSGDEAEEYLLWATLDSRVQQAKHASARTSLPLHVFQAGRSLGGTGTLRHWPDHARVVATEVVPDADHLGIIHHPQLCASVKARLRAADAARGAPRAGARQEADLAPG